MPNTDTWGPEHKGALKSAIMGRQWTQQRLHSAGLAQDSLCRLCVDMPEGGAGWNALSSHAMSCSSRFQPAAHARLRQGGVGKDWE